MPAVGPRPGNLLAGVAALILGAATLGGCVSTRDIEGLQQQLADVQRQMLQLQMVASSKEEVAGLEETLSQRTDALLRSEADMQVGIQELSTQIAQLQAQLEDTNYRLSQVSQQIAAGGSRGDGGRDVPVAPYGQPTPGASSSAPAPVESQPEADPRTLYQTAYNDYLRGNYDLAILAFRQYVEAFPSTDLADNALYWIGECFYSQRDYVKAIEEFDTVLERYPRSDKTASSLLKKGFAYFELGQREAGTVQLQNLMNRFPASDEANLAAGRLAAMNGGAADS